MEVFTRGIEPFPQLRGQRRRSMSNSLETLLLAHTISIDGGLVFEVERDRSEYLSESQSFEFSQDRFRRESFIEALDDGVE